MVDEAQIDALTVSATFKNLHINAPDTNRISHKLVTSVGSATIFLAVNGTDNEPFFTLEDAGSAGGLPGGLFETERALNYSLFSRLADRWLVNFVTYLDMTIEAAEQ